jgi:MoaA/NifB/PqqE/SkfB family radical SAM enzyme
MYLEIMNENAETIFSNYEKPFYVYISLTNLCNANCSFCDVRRNEKKVNALDIKPLIDELSSLGTKYVHFTGGGEPFINDDIFEYLEYCTEKKMKIVLISNGLNLDENKIKKLSNYNIEAFFFSIDSHDAKVHNELRRTEDLFETATKNINLLKKYMPDIQVILNHVLNNKNIDFFENFINMKKEVNFDYINPIVIKDCEDLFPSDSQINTYNEKLNDYYKLASKMEIKFLCKDINFFDNIVKENGDREINIDLKCVYPSFCAFIDCPTGNVYPCDCSIHRDPNIYNIGNLIDDTFTKIWNGESRRVLRQKLLMGGLDCKLKCDEANCMFNDKYFCGDEK